VKKLTEPSHLVAANPRKIRVRREARVKATLEALSQLLKKYLVSSEEMTAVRSVPGKLSQLLSA
jgi:hypothetical protein